MRLKNCIAYVVEIFAIGFLFAIIFRVKLDAVAAALFAAGILLRWFADDMRR